MGIQYTVIFYFLLFEILIYLLLVIPWPSRMRKFLIHFFTNSSFAQYLHKVLAFLLVLSVILFAESLRAMFMNIEKHIALEEHEAKDAHHHISDDIIDQKIHSRIFFAQRNVYLTSFTLFVAFALYRLTSILKALSVIEDKLENQEGLEKVKPEIESKNDKKNN